MKILEGKKKEFFQRIVVILSIFPNQNKNMNIIIVGGAENRPIRKIVPKGKKENSPIFQNSKKYNRKIVPKSKN